MQNNILNPDNYLEKPRPNFYNVIKKIRESKVYLIGSQFTVLQVAYKRILYVAKLNEAEMKIE